MTLPDQRARNEIMIDGQLEQFRRNGFLLLQDFYKVDTEIEPILEGIRVIIELMAKKHGIGGPYSTAEEAMSQCYPKLIAINRAWGGEIYDAVKQIPEFVELVANKRNARLFEALRPGAKSGIAGGGYGIRIDNPGEDKFRALWHQDFSGQLRSYDGLVLWSPLLAVTPEMGPVQIAVGSHVEGYVSTYDDNGNLGPGGSYAVRLQGEEDLLAKYETVAPLTKPGDLLVMDFLLLHQSGHNISKTPRWSMQLRYFNFRDPLGIKISWKGLFAAGERSANVIPNLIGAK